MGLDIDFKNHYGYIYGSVNKDYIIESLLSMGQLLFYNSFRMVKFDNFKSLNVPYEQVDKKVAKKFASETTVDSFRFVTCFDNYMKSILLSKDYLIHQAKNGKLKELQKDKPIHLKEVLDGIVHTPDEEYKWKLSSINSHTIPISYMLKPKYQEVIGLPEDICSIILPLVEYRNKHHLFLEETMEMSKKVISDFEKLRDFMDNVYLPLAVQYENKCNEGRAKKNG